MYKTVVREAWSYVRTSWCVVLIAVVAFMVAAMAAAPAQAQPVQPLALSTVESTVFPAAPVKDPYAEFNCEERSCLPLYRWKDATALLHQRQPSGLFNIPTQIRTITKGASHSMFMTVGNALWSVTMAVTEWASNLDVLKGAGAKIDGVVGKLGKLLLDPSTIIIPALMGCAVIWVLWQTYRRNAGMMAFRKLGMSIVTLSLIGAMVTGAAQTTKGGDDGFNPGFLSPGWFAQTTSNVIDAGASSIAQFSIVSNSNDLADTSGRGSFECGQYVNMLRNAYTSQTTRDSGYKGSATVPLLLSSLWENTGLKIWQDEQLGSSYFASKNYCHLLEWQSNIPPSEQAAIANRGIDVTESVKANASAPAWGPANYPVFDDKTQIDVTSYVIDQAMVGWAVCEPGGSVKAAFAEGKWKPLHDASDLEAGCNLWWNANGQDKNVMKPNQNFLFFGKNVEGSVANYDALDAGETPSDIYHVTSGGMDSYQRESIVNYLAKLHGDAPGGANAFMYVLTAFTTMIVFAGASLVIVISKIAILVYMLLMLLVLVISLWPGKSDDHLVKKFFKEFVGVVIVGFGYSLILGALVFLTILTTDGLAGVGSTDGPLSMGQMVVVAVAPLGAAFILKMFFKNMLHMPDPLSAKGALGYGMMGGLIGAGGMGVMQGAARNGAGAARRLASAGAKKLTGAKAGGTSTGEKVASNLSNSKMAKNAPSGSELKQARRNLRRGGVPDSVAVQSDGTQDVRLADSPKLVDHGGRVSNLAADVGRGAVSSAEGLRDKWAGASAGERARMVGGSVAKVAALGGAGVLAAGALGTLAPLALPALAGFPAVQSAASNAVRHIRDRRQAPLLDEVNRMRQERELAQKAADFDNKVNAELERDRVKAAAQARREAATLQGQPAGGALSPQSQPAGAPTEPGFVRDVPPEPEYVPEAEDPTQYAPPPDYDAMEAEAVRREERFERIFGSQQDQAAPPQASRTVDPPARQAEPVEPLPRQAEPTRPRHMASPSQERRADVPAPKPVTPAPVTGTPVEPGKTPGERQQTQSIGREERELRS